MSLIIINTHDKERIFQEKYRKFPKKRKPESCVKVSFMNISSLV
jgi:hypothetical protein